MNRIANLAVRSIAVALPLAVMLIAAGGAARAAGPPAATTGGFQSDLDFYLADAEEKILALEGAMPQSTFTWRPGPGVRSVAEVYLHIAYANYRVTMIATGKEIPAAAGWVADRGKWDTKTTDKTQIKKILEVSFAHARDAVKSLPDSELEKKVNFFGKDVTRRAAMLQLQAHAYEHLGQSIAYARANKVTPPWSKSDNK